MSGATGPVAVDVSEGGNFKTIGYNTLLHVASPSAGFGVRAYKTGILCPYIAVLKYTTGINAERFGYADAPYSMVLRATTGYYAQYMGWIRNSAGWSVVCTTGHHATNMSTITSTGTSGNQPGTGTAYNPAASATLGNNNAQIVWS